MDTPDQIALSILEQRNEWLVNGVLKPATLGVLIADAIRAERKQVEQVTADATLVAEMSALRAELLAAKTRTRELRDALERLIHMAECDMVPGPSTLRQARAAIVKTEEPNQ